MLYSEIIAVCSEIHTKHINSLCGKNVEFVNVKHGGTYSNHWALEGYKHKTTQKPLRTIPKCAIYVFIVTYLLNNNSTLWTLIAFI
jgi:hypothetical protein